MIRVLPSKALLLLSMCFCIHFAGATNYYINNRTGDDHNPGTSKSLPWKSLQNLEKKQFLPGDSILFAKGSAYRGGVVFTSSGTSDKPIVFTAYSADAELIFRTPRSDLQDSFP